MENTKKINYEFLEENGEKLNSVIEGSCILYEYNGIEYVVLCDNTVITREEDNNMDDAIFPY